MAADLLRTFRAVCGAFLLAAAFAAPLPAYAADAGSRTLVVAVDHAIEHSHEMWLLSQLVQDGVDSQRQWIEERAFDRYAEITIGDAEREKALVGMLEAKYAKKNGYSLLRSPARTFWLSFTPAAQKKYGNLDFGRRFSFLEDFIMRLRPPLAGVEIEHRDDGAIIRFRDPALRDVVRKELDNFAIVHPLSRTTWHVAWNKEIASEDLAKHPVEGMIRFVLAEPLDLTVAPNGQGAVFTVENPERYAAFVMAVRKAFARSVLITLTETDSLILRIAPLDLKKNAVANPYHLPDPSVSHIMFEAEEMANPAVEIAVLGDAVWAHAKNPAHNPDRAAVIRTALAGRPDLVIASRADQSLLIKLAPGAHLLPPRPAVGFDRIAKDVQARAHALKLRPVRIVPAGPERARIVFATDTDAMLFRRAVADDGRFAVRPVEEPPEKDAAKTPPSPGDERLPTAQGGHVWVKPETILTGDMIADAGVDWNPAMRETYIHIRLTDEGRAVFAAATRFYIGKRLAVVADGVVLTAPVVREPIEGGKLEITGTFTLEAAKELVRRIRLRSGALPLKIVEEPR